MSVDLTSGAIRDAFTGTVPKVPVSFTYRFRLLTVLAGLLLLQSLYLLLIVTVAYVSSILTIAVFNAHVTFNFLTIMVYAAAPVTGIITVVFLLKPILVRPAAPPAPIELTRANEPLFFEYLDRLCQTLRAPRPSRVFVDLQINASVARQTWRGLILGQFHLTFGLPLAAYLKLPQFTGILAHELGHFSQHFGMRCFFLIQIIQSWFARVAHERDSLDQWLEDRMDDDWRVVLVARLAAAVVNLSRKFLTMLMQVGQWLALGFSRQMEFDADRHEAAIAGVPVFEQTQGDLTVLGHARQMAIRESAREFKLGRLPEDQVSYLRIHLQKISPATRETILSEAAGAQTGRLDTHPCFTERVASVRRTAFAGIFQFEAAPVDLFQDFSSLCRRCTRHEYLIAGVSLGSENLVTTADLQLAASWEEDCNGAAQQLFKAPLAFCTQWFALPECYSGAPKPVGPFHPYSPAPADIEAFNRALETNALHFTARLVREAGIQVNPSSFQVPSSEIEDIVRAQTAGADSLHRLVFKFQGESGYLAARFAAVCDSNTTPQPTAAWKSYEALCRQRGQIREIGTRLAAHSILVQSGQTLPVTACANLLFNLEQDARAGIQNIVNETVSCPATVILNPDAPHTLAEQLRTETGSVPEMNIFVERFQLIMEQTLAQLCRFALARTRGEH